MKIIPSVPTRALNLCSAAAYGAAERIEFDSNRWISRCELTVCYHRWMQWWRNDAGTNLLALQNPYGLYLATIKSFFIRWFDSITWMLFWKCSCLASTLRLPLLIFFLFASGLKGEEKRSRFICVIKILEHICNVYWSDWTGAKHVYENYTVSFENVSPIYFKSHFSRLQSTCSTNRVVLSDADLFVGQKLL